MWPRFRCQSLWLQFLQVILLLHPASILLTVLTLGGCCRACLGHGKAPFHRRAGCCQCKGQEPETECCGPVRQAAARETNHRLASCWICLSFMSQAVFSLAFSAPIQAIFSKLRFMSIVVPMGGADRYLMHRYETKASLIWLWHDTLSLWLAKTSKVVDFGMRNPSWNQVPSCQCVCLLRCWNNVAGGDDELCTVDWCLIPAKLKDPLPSSSKIL